MRGFEDASHSGHMALLETASAQRDQVVSQEVQRRMEEAADVSDTLGDLRNNVRERINQVPDMVHGKEIVTITAEQRAEVQRVMDEKAKEVEDATDGYEHVALTDELPDGVLGQTQLENPGVAVVSEDLVHAPEELKRTAMHESDEDVGHASQVRPDVPNYGAALIVDGEEFDATTVIEGDVERGVAQEMDGSTDIHRADQPDETYRRGQEMGNDVAGRVGEGVWKTALKETGDYGQIQEKLWEVQLKTSSDIHDVLRIAGEAQTTGYYDEASRVLAPAMQRIMTEQAVEAPATMAA